MQIDVPVLVVGGGPVGQMAGILLAQQGLDNLVIERRAHPQRAPAAHVVNARSFEICRAAGVDMEAIRAAAKDPADAGYAIWVTALAGEEVARLPFERQDEACLALTPTPLRNLSQHRFEPILLETLRKLQGAEIRYGHQWESSEQDATGVTSLIRDLATDRTYTVRSRVTIAADGAGSRIRKSIGIEMDGPAELQRFAMIHLGANFRPLVRERPGVLYWQLDPASPGTFVAHDIDREWVYMHSLKPGESEADYDDALWRAVVERALGTADVPFEILTVGSWTMTCQVAQRFRDGRIFLAGDAAHRFPPTGGLGLNTGVQDVHGLVWKLAAVEEGWAPPALLDSYESERRPVAQDNADQSLRNSMKLLEIPKALGTLEDPTTERMRQTLADPARRAGLEAAIAAQAEHFDMLGLQLGFVYENGALVSDGTPAPEVENRVREYVPSARPGARLPHFWLDRDGVRLSSLDLVQCDRFTLLASPDDGWAAAAASIASVPLTCVSIGDGLCPVDGDWLERLGLEPGGALLLRPDQHVAWRTRALPAQPAAALQAALSAILSA